MTLNLSQAGIAPYISAEISTAKTRSYSVGVEINKGNTTFWNEAFVGGGKTATGKAKEEDLFVGIETGVEHSIWSDNTNSINVGGKISADREVFTEYTPISKEKNNLIISRALFTAGADKQINPKTNVYMNAGFGVQSFKSNTLNSKGVIPAYDATIGIERSLKNSKYRVEAFVENYPNWTENNHASQTFLGARLTFMFGK